MIDDIQDVVHYISFWEKCSLFATVLLKEKHLIKTRKKSIDFPFFEIKNYLIS